MGTEERRDAGIKTVGVVGLGVMGFPMMRHLVDAGFAVKAYARRPERLAAATEAGADSVGGLAEVAQGVDALVLVLPNAPEVEEVLFGPEGVAEVLAPGSLVLDCTTLAPAAARDFEERLAARGVQYVDAPVSGGQKGAEDGALAVMVGGRDDAVARAWPVLEAFGKSITHIGPPGAGQVTKACNQLVVAATIETVAEALVLAAKSGVSPSAVREALLGGFAYSRILEVHGQRMIDGTFDPGFRMRMQLKDARIVKEQAEHVGAPTPAFASVVTQIEQVVADPEDGEKDHSALILPLLDGPVDGFDWT